MRNDTRQEHAFQAYSFDVFDTCLVRTVARPQDLFMLVAQALVACDDQQQLSHFVSARIRAEQLARAASIREDITLEEIYANFVELQGWSIERSTAVAAEIRLELDSVRPVAKTVGRIDEARESGARIIFISDMYLPSGVVRQMLRHTGLARPQDPVYVSGELGITKGSGKLFRHVLEQEDLAPGALLHYGDNPRSDYLVPLSLGIGAELCSSTRLSPLERRIARQAGCPPRHSSCLAGISRVVRLQTRPRVGTPTEVAAAVIAPLLTTFVAWVLAEARRRGLRRLYFVARDGQILLRIARELCTEHRDPPELRYLLGSRETWLLPGVFDCDHDSLAFAFPERQSTAIRDCLFRLGVDPEVVRSPLQANGFDVDLDRQLPPAEVARFRRLLTREPGLADAVLRAAAAARELVLKYFEQEGLLERVPFALVDIGWTLRTYQAVTAMLSHRGVNSTYGFFLGARRTDAAAALAGTYSAFVAETPDRDAPGRAVFEHMALIENAFTIADHGSVIGYRMAGPRVVPVFDRCVPFAGRSEYIDTVHSIATATAHEFARAGLIASELAHLRAATLVNTDRFLECPFPDHARELQGIPITPRRAVNGSWPLARPLGLDDLFALGRHAFRTSFGRSRQFPWDYDRLGSRYSWLEGSVALSSPLVRRIAQLGLFGLRALRRLAGRSGQLHSGTGH